MTLNHQNNTINGFFRQKFHEKEVLHMLLALIILLTAYLTNDLEDDLESP